MIRSDHDRKRAAAQLIAQDAHLVEYETSLRKEGLNEAEIRRMSAALRTFRAKLSEEIETYDRLRSGDLRVIRNVSDPGRRLVYLRIGRGMSQRMLAEKLGCDESMVSRDERNEYHGISLDRAFRIANVLNATLLIEAAPVERTARERVEQLITAVESQPVATPPKHGVRLTGVQGLLKANNVDATASAA